MEQKKNKKSVAVLMSTYNGEKYLREQIESVLAQAGVEVHLFIRDDGSTDTTKEILHEYQMHYKNIKCVFGRNIGVGNSFMELLYSVPAEYDYYAFCDQDDIWLEDKLLCAIEIIERTGCTLYSSNQECVDADGNKLCIRYDANYQMNLSTLAIMCKNQIAGCTFVFSQELQQFLVTRRPSKELLKLRIHDVWVAAAASVIGSIYYDNNSYICYRQHENNVVGAKKSTKIDALKMQFSKLRNKEERKGRSKLAKELLNCFSEYIDDDLIKACADPETFHNKTIIVSERKRITRYSNEKPGIFALKVVLGFF